LTEEDLRALIRAKREGVRRLEESVLDSGGRRVDVTLEQQRARAPRTVETPPPARGFTDPEPEGRDAVWDSLLEQARVQTPIREAVVDNPEGHATGLTVQPAVETWEDLDQQLAADPLDPDLARAIADDLLVTDDGALVQRPAGPVPTPIDQAPSRRLVLNDDTHWVSPSSQRSAIDPARTEPDYEGANQAFVRVIAGIVDNLRRNVQKTYPERLTAAQRRELREYRKEFSELLATLV
jgi:hypothetical protein